MQCALWVCSKLAPTSNESIGFSSFSRYFMAINCRGPRPYLGFTSWLLTVAPTGVDWYTLLSTGVSRALKRGGLGSAFTLDSGDLTVLSPESWLGFRESLFQIARKFQRLSGWFLLIVSYGYNSRRILCSLWGVLYMLSSTVLEYHATKIDKSVWLLSHTMSEFVSIYLNKNS